MAKGLYIHIPFCVKKCRYCDFVSFTNGDRNEYIKALKNELVIRRGESVDTVFIGGGTPTCLDDALLYELLSFINKNFNIANEYEWSIEMNPKTADLKKLKLMKECGVNRVSVGVQSFNDNELGIIGRVHNASEAIEAVCAVAESFENFNIDLMSGLPGQNAESFNSTLSTAVSLNPTHISCYSLILEENTELYDLYNQGSIILPGEDEDRAMYSFAKTFLGDAGYERYEISNFAKKGMECRHNLKYWQCDEYIGAGLAAHSYTDGRRYSNTICMKSYLEGKTSVEEVNLTYEDMKAEFIIMSLRLSEGVSGKKYRNRFKSDFYSDYKAVIDKFISFGLMEKKEENFRLTDAGFNVSNSVMCEFV